MEAWLIYLGHASNTNEVFTGLKNGNVVRARSITRVVEEARWSKELVLGVVGIPSHMKHVEDGAPTDDEVERQEAPHDFDADLVEPAEDRPAEKDPVDLEEKLDSGHGLRLSRSEWSA